MARYSSLSLRTQARYGATIKIFMKWCGFPMDDYRFKLPKSLPQYIEDIDIDDLLNAIKNKKSRKDTIKRDLLIVELFLTTGMRRDELASLQPKEVHDDFLMVRKGKGQKDRMIPLLPDLAQRLSVFIQCKRPDENIFGLKGTSIGNKIRLFANKAGLTDIHTHSLRHKYATDLSKAGVNIRVIQELLGHEDVSSTMGYTAVTEQSLRDAVGVLDKIRESSRQDQLETNAQKEDVLISTKEPLFQGSYGESATAEIKDNKPNPLLEQRTGVHHQRMLELVDCWRTELRPQLRYNPLRSLSGPDPQRGNGKPPLLWHVPYKGSFTLCISAEITSDPETLIIKDYLWQHLRSSNQSWLLDDPDHGLLKWKSIGGLELVKRVELLTSIDDSCREMTGYPLLDNINETGPFLDYANTIWGTITGIMTGSLSYTTKNDPNKNSYLTKYGAYVIARSLNRRDTDRYVNWHQKLRAEWETNHLTQDILELMRTRERITAEIEQALAKLTVDGHIPGRCEGCP